MAEPKKDLRQIIDDLQKIRREFERAAVPPVDRIAALDLSIAGLTAVAKQVEHEELQAARRKKNSELAAAVTNNGKKTPPKDGFVFLVEGSGGFRVNRVATLGSLVPLNTILAALDDVRAAATAFLPKTQLVGGLWGDARGVTQDAFDPALRNPDTLKKTEQELGYGTNFTSLVEDMRDIVTAAADKKTRLHFVIASDGDVWNADVTAAEQALKDLLASHPGVTVDFIQLGNWSKTPMETIADNLRTAYPKRSSFKEIEMHMKEPEKTVKKAVAAMNDLLASRTQGRKPKPVPGLSPPKIS